MKLLFLLLLLLPTSRLFAEPSNTVLYLINEPVTLFEKGLKSFNNMVARTDQFSELLQEPSTFGDYDIEKNRITINGNAYQDYKTLKNNLPKDTCKKLIERTKVNLGYEKDGSSSVLTNMYGVAQRFRPQGFTKSDEPQSLESDLASIITIKFEVRLSQNNSAPYKTAVECTSDLRSSKIYFSET